MEIKIYSLFSGSSGNCTWFKIGELQFLVDAGGSCKAINDALGTLGSSLDRISHVFVTHEHSDHVAGLPTFFNKHSAPVYITEPSYLDYIRGKGFDYRDRFTVVGTDFSVTVGELNVTAIPVRHDSAACVAYRVEGNGISLGICTDVGCPTDALFEHFKDCGCVITEANYDEKMLLCGIYPQELKYRIMSESGHTSNDDCARFVTRLAESGVKNVLLAHVSPENNTPQLAVYVVAEALKNHGIELPFLAAAPRDDAIVMPSDLTHKC